MENPNKIIEKEENKEEYYKNIVRVKFEYGEGWLFKNDVQKYIILKTEKEREKEEKDREKELEEKRKEKEKEKSKKK